MVQAFPYIFANKRANRMKILLCDGFGVWLLARRLHRGRFVWSALRSGDPVALDALQLQALVSGLPWQYAAADIDNLNESQLRELVAHMQQDLGEEDARLQERDSTIHCLKIEKDHLTHEIAILRRYRFGKRSETKGRSPQQSLLDDLVDEDLAALDRELEQLVESHPEPTRKTAKPRRQRLPEQLSRTEVRHDPESTTCDCCQSHRMY